jgi:hypothetical protein
MNNFKLKNDPYVSNWLLSIDATANIERNYLQAIKVFCGFTKIPPDELILKADQEAVRSYLNAVQSLYCSFIFSY